MESKRSFNRIFYTIRLSYFKDKQFHLEDEINGAFVCAFGIKTLQRYAYNCRFFLPHPRFVDYSVNFSYDMSEPITETEYIERIRNGEHLVRFLVRSIVFSMCIHIFTNPFNVSQLNNSNNEKK